MKRGQFMDSQAIEVPRKQEAGSRTADLCRKHGISENVFDVWKSKCRGFGVSEAKRSKTLKDESGRLQRLLVEAMPDNGVLRNLAAKKV